MDNKTVRAVYEDGEIIFAEPVDIDGCWRVQVVFLEREDADDVHFERDPHSPESILPLPDRLDEVHRQAEIGRPTIGPF